MTLIANAAKLFFGSMLVGLGASIGVGIVALFLQGTVLWLLFGGM